MNFDESLIELVHETKWLRRMGLDIPEAAKVLLQQEIKYRNYCDTLTELLLASFLNPQLCWALYFADLSDKHPSLSLAPYEHRMQGAIWLAVSKSIYSPAGHTWP